MKIGIRKPSLKKSFKARTTGKAKRAVKKAVIPGYGKKGTGWIKDPKKAAYNKIYNKTTISVSQLASGTKKGKTSSNFSNKSECYSNSSISSANTSNVMLINSDNKIKKCKVGFCWPHLFFFFLHPLYKLDFKNFIIQFIIYSILLKIPFIANILVPIAYLSIAISYNKVHINDLLKKGYVPYDYESSQILSRKGFIFESLDYKSNEV